MPLPRALAFDLGDTLVEYEGLPLSWVNHYGEALNALGDHLHVTLDAERLEAGRDVLRRYNTRLHPRTIEYPFTMLLGELTSVWGIRAPTDPLSSARAFFDVFRQRLRCFPDSVATLERLRRAGHTLAGFTDVPYGMPPELVHEDVEAADLSHRLDVLLTSVEIGHRKPAPETLRAVAARLGVAAGDLAYVGNEPKDVAAALAAGCTAIFLDRAGSGETHGQHRTIRELSEI